MLVVVTRLSNYVNISNKFTIISDLSFWFKSAWLYYNIHHFPHSREQPSSLIQQQRYWSIELFKAVVLKRFQRVCFAGTRLCLTSNVAIIEYRQLDYREHFCPSFAHFLLHVHRMKWCIKWADVTLKTRRHGDIKRELYVRRPPLGPRWILSLLYLSSGVMALIFEPKFSLLMLFSYRCASDGFRCHVKSKKCTAIGQKGKRDWRQQQAVQNQANINK